MASGSTLALREAVALAVHFEDVDVVGEAIQQGAGEPLRAKHAGPLVERQIAGHDYGAALLRSMSTAQPRPSLAWGARVTTFSWRSPFSIGCVRETRAHAQL